MTECLDQTEKGHNSLFARKWKLVSNRENSEVQGAAQTSHHNLNPRHFKQGFHFL